MLIDRTTILLLMPEIALVAMAVYIFVVGGWLVASRAWLFVCAGALLVAGLALFYQGGELFGPDWRLQVPGGRETADAVVHGPLIVDFFGYAARWFAVTLGFLALLISDRSRSEKSCSSTAVCLALIVAGLMLVAQAGNVVLLFLALQLISIPMYVLLSREREDDDPAASNTRYLIWTGVSSALLLVGLALLCGAAGSVHLEGVQRALLLPEAGEGRVAWPVAASALTLIVAGLAINVGVVPLCFCVSDNRERTSKASTGVLAVFPTVAAVLVLLRLLIVTFPLWERFGWQAVLVLALLTMTFGNIVALRQNNLRRLLAWCSIAHAGFVLVGVAAGLAGGPDPAGYGGLAAAWLYLVLYAVATAGVFAILAYLSCDEREVSEISDLSGLSLRQPALAVAMAALLFSLAGIAPLAGFWGKLMILFGVLEVARSAASAIVSLCFVALAVIMLANVVLAAASYLRVVVTIYSPHTEESPRPKGGWGASCAAFLAAACLIAAGLSPWALMEAAGRPPGPAAVEMEPTHATSPIDPK